jgi:uncharacterized membrane protein
MTNDPAPAPGGTDPRWRLSPTKIVVAVLLLIGIVVPLLVGTYAKDEPRFLGFPFFYWYQLLWVPITSILIWIAYRSMRNDD